MFKITLNRVSIATVLIYFPISTYGQTHSITAALGTLGMFIVVMLLGAGENEYISNESAKESEDGYY